MAAESEVRDTLTRSPGFTGLDRVSFAGNAAATRAFEQINQILSTRFGKRAPFAERAVTWADLQRYGFATLKTPSGSIIDPGAAVNFPDPIPVPSEPTLDPSTPPAPSGLTITGAVVTNILEWTAPAFGYFGYTEVFRSSADNLSTAVKVGQTNASLYADAIGQADITYYYWIRHVSKAGNVGPFNASGGTAATTSAGSAATVADGAITTAKLANLAVSTAKIADGAIVNAKIGDAQITNAKIADAQITDAKIVNLSAGKLTAGAIAVDQFIQSSNYSAGVGGWRINGNGNAELNNVTVRGTVFASGGSFTGQVNAATINGGTINGTQVNASLIVTPYLVNDVAAATISVGNWQPGAAIIDLGANAGWFVYKRRPDGTEIGILGDGSTRFANRIGGPTGHSIDISWYANDPYSGPGGSGSPPSAGEGSP